MPAAAAVARRRAAVEGPRPVPARPARRPAARAAEDAGPDLPVPPGPRRLPEPARRAGEEVADREPGGERDDEARLARQRERPPDAEAGTLVGRGGDVGVVAREPAEIARPEDHAEAGREAPRVEPEGRSGPPQERAPGGVTR